MEKELARYPIIDEEIMLQRRRWEIFEQMKSMFPDKMFGVEVELMGEPLIKSNSLQDEEMPCPEMMMSRSEQVRLYLERRQPAEEEQGTSKKQQEVKIPKVEKKKPYLRTEEIKEIADSYFSRAFSFRRIPKDTYKVGMSFIVNTARREHWPREKIIFESRAFISSQKRGPVTPNRMDICTPE